MILSCLILCHRPVTNAGRLGPYKLLTAQVVFLTYMCNAQSLLGAAWGHEAAACDKKVGTADAV